MDLFERIWFFVFLGAFVGIVVAILIHNINIKFYNNRIITRIVDLISCITVILLLVFIFIFFGYILLGMHFALYRFFFILFDRLLDNSNAANYISITSVLIILAYTPHSIGEAFFKLLSKASGKRSDFIHLYKIFTGFFRLKLMIYLIAFLLVFISSLEFLLHEPIINNGLWLNLSPFINQSVLTFLALDRFIKMLIDHWSDIRKQLETISKTVMDIIKREV